ncbi:Uncharacterised protein [Serratia quinivorans]|jgi:hypothetical protein|nr:Uncharacterised protein [Serratia quinivorans]
MPWLSWRLSGLALSQQSGRQRRLFFSVGNTIPLIIHENGRKSRVAQVHAANNQFSLAACCSTILRVFLANAGSTSNKIETSGRAD